MSPRLPPALGVLLAAAAIQAPGGAQARRDQDEALAARRAGQMLPLRQIEERVVPTMPGATYLGPEPDLAAGTYRLKFMRGASVIWIDVDARTGVVRGRSDR